MCQGSKAGKSNGGLHLQDGNAQKHRYSCAVIQSLSATPPRVLRTGVESIHEEGHCQHRESPEACDKDAPLHLETQL